MLWKLRKPPAAPGPFTFHVNGRDVLTVDVDANGCFQLTEPLKEPIPLYAFATVVQQPV